MKDPKRHHLHQIVIMLGMVVGSVMTLINGELYIHATIIQVATNLFWIWEDSV